MPFPAPTIKINCLQHRTSAQVAHLNRVLYLVQCLPHIQIPFLITPLPPLHRLTPISQVFAILH